MYLNMILIVKRSYFKMKIHSLFFITFRKAWTKKVLWYAYGMEGQIVYRHLKIDLLDN